jgi:hypothetical protein
MSPHGPASLPPVADLLRLFEKIETIAVVGASSDPEKKAHSIPAYLQQQGFRIVPVNPGGGEILGVPAFPSLLAVDVPVDAVDVFRPSEEAPAIARQAVEIGARVLWLQLGISSPEAARIAGGAGMTVVMDACMGAVHRKLVRRDGLEPRSDPDGAVPPGS